MVRAMRKLLLLVLLTACGPTGPTDECKAYVGCYELMGTANQDLRDTYGEEGTCWQEGTATAQTCTTVCKKGLESLKKAYPNAGC